MSVNLRPASESSRAAAKGPRSSDEDSPRAAPPGRRSSLEALKRGPREPHAPDGPQKGGKRAEESASKGWRPIHHINQLRPEGADKNYVNGAFNCGPAVVAMMARGHGRMDDLNDAQLVQQLGQGIVSREGTTPEGIAQMMARADVPLAGDALGAGYAEKDVQDHLRQGHKLIAQVRSSNPRSQEDSSHYVVVEGMTRDGNYVISDPLAKRPYVVKPEVLKEAVLKAPPDGGMLIPVASPGEVQPATSAPATSAPAPAAPPPATAVAQSADAFKNPSSREIAARRVTDPHGIPALNLAEPGVSRAVQGGANPVPLKAERPYELPELSFSPPQGTPAAQPARAAPETPAAAPLIVDPSVAKDLQQMPDDKAFTVTGTALADADTEFKAVEDKPLDERLKENEARNDFKLDINYGDDEIEDTKDLKEAFFSGKISVADAVKHLRELKERGDPEAYKLLSRLEGSRFWKDKKVLEEIEKSDKKDPGTGAKTIGDAF